MDAVHEMLLQSWAPDPGNSEPGAIRIFPATPWRWHEASFADLRAEGGHRVSAKRKNNATTWFRIVAGNTGPVRIRDNFGGPSRSGTSRCKRKSGADFVVKFKTRPDAGSPVADTCANPARARQPGAAGGNQAE